MSSRLGPIRLWRGIGSIVAIGLVGAWFVLLRPVALGGSASYVVVAGVSMEPHLHTGDLVIAHVEPAYTTGAVVAYRIPAGNPAAGSLVIHRIVGGNGRDGFITQGDNKDRPDPWRPTAANVVGSSWLEFPNSGRVLLALRQPPLLAFVLAVLAGAWFYTSGGRKKPSAAEEQPAGAVNR